VIKFVCAVSLTISTATLFLAGCGSSSTLVDIDAPTPPLQAKPSIEAVPAALSGEVNKTSDRPGGEVMAIAPTPFDVNKNLPTSDDIPVVLTPADAERYRLVFALQDKGDFKAADKIIATIQDQRLQGHVYAQRYLYASYRSSYLELAGWMDKYAELPDSRQIYELALKRRGNNAPALVQPVGRIWLTDSRDELPSLEMAPTVPPRKPAIEKLAASSIDKMQERLARGWIDGAQETLKSSENLNIFSPLEIDFWQSRIAFAAFLEGDDRRSREIASAAISRSQSAVPLAHWITGLIAWRQKNYEEAQMRFAVVAERQSLSAWNRAAAAYWAARSANKRGHQSEETQYLKQAANYPRTLYGQLARHQLGLDTGLTLVLGTQGTKEMASLMASSRAARALALLQVGQKDRAEKELRILANEAPAEILSPLAKVIEKAGMSAVALHMGQSTNLRGSGLADILAYPVPPYRPRKGFVVDKALLFALMRQESAFRPEARSKVGARGLMQLMPATAKSIAKRTGVAHYDPDALDDPEFNLDLGQSYVEHLLESPPVERDLFMLAAAYNAGPGAAKRWHARIRHGGDPLLFIESLPRSETRDFVEQVLTNFWIYRAKLGQKSPSKEDLVQGRWPSYVAMDAPETKAAEATPWPVSTKP